MSVSAGNLLIQLAAIKAQETALAEKKALIQESLVIVMKQAGIGSLTQALGDGGKVKGTLVEAERLKIDEPKLKARLTAKQWKQVTKQVLDNELLEAAVAMNVVDPMVVAEVSETVMNKPYIRVTGSTPSLGVAGVTLTDDAGGLKPAARRIKAKKK